MKDMSKSRSVTLKRERAISKRSSTYGLSGERSAIQKPGLERCFQDAYRGSPDLQRFLSFFSWNTVAYCQKSVIMVPLLGAVKSYYFTKNNKVGRRRDGLISALSDKKIESPSYRNSRRIKGKRRHPSFLSLLSVYLGFAQCLPGKGRQPIFAPRGTGRQKVCFCIQKREVSIEC